MKTCWCIPARKDKHTLSCNIINDDIERNIKKAEVKEMPFSLAVKEVRKKFCYCEPPNEQQKAMRYTPACNVDLALEYLEELLRHGKEAISK